MRQYELSSRLPRYTLVRQLHRGDFIDEAHNIVLIGGPGTGKTHIALAHDSVHAETSRCQKGVAKTAVWRTMRQRQTWFCGLPRLATIASIRA